MSNLDFYSQHGEDFLLSELFRDKKDGFYIEVGAFDGIHLSNTYYFEKLGWNGICIEAHPLYFPKCRENRINSMCIHAACTSDETLKKVMFSAEDLGLLSGVEEREDINQRYAGRGLKFEGFNKICVPAITLNHALSLKKEMPGIDLISIDVEGHELAVLKGLNFKIHHVRVFVIEANTPADEVKLDEFMVDQEKYYKSRRLGANIFYCRELLDAQALTKIDVKNYVGKSSHPLGKQYDLPTGINYNANPFDRILRKIKGLIKVTLSVC